MPYYIKKSKKTSKRSKPDLVKKLDRIFSLYIRLRDAMPGGYCKCISCGRIKPFDEIDCGHFFSRVHMSTRFSEDNCNGECRYCNRFSAEHLFDYQNNLIKKIGQTRFNLLEVKHHEHKKWSDFELEQMIEFYKKKVQELSSAKSIRVSL